MFIYRDGVVKQIKGHTTARKFWFVNLGAKIGVETGKGDKPGVESLCDGATLKNLASFNEAQIEFANLPARSTGSDAVDCYGD